MKYYIAPTTYGIHDIRIVNARVVSEGDMFILDSKEAGVFRSRKENLHDTIEEAQKALIEKVIAFKSNVDYTLSKALEETNAEPKRPDTRRDS